MNYLCIDYLEFVPGKLVDDNHSAFIFVFSYRRNNTINKKKKMHIGAITHNNKAHTWVFIPRNDVVVPLTNKTLLYIASFINQLNTRKIKYDAENIELTRR